MGLVFLLLNAATAVLSAATACIAKSCVSLCSPAGGEVAAVEPRRDEVGAGGKAVRRFGWKEIDSLADRFSPASLIGEGGFSTVHAARLPPPHDTVVALKLLRGGERLHRAFRHELDVLLRTRHPRIVRLVGFSDDREEEGVLVFEYAANGSLFGKLHGGGGEKLRWGQRMRIAYGVAAALEYLHEECHPQIVHGDVTAANVLLDAAMEPKLCDFGSAVVGFSAAVAPAAVAVGSPGYADPHYLRTGLLSRKSDAYGFGVVALELLTGAEAPSLAARAAPVIRSGGALLLVDPGLGGEYDAAEAMAVAEVAARCVGEQPALRPTMAEVLRVMRDSVPSAMAPCVADGKL